MQTHHSDPVSSILVAGSDPVLDTDTLHALEAVIGGAALGDMLALVPQSVSDELTRIEGALAAGDLDAARRAAHTLKGFSGNLGLARLSRCAQRLERHLSEFSRTAPQARDLARRLTQVARETVDALAHRS